MRVELIETFDWKVPGKRAWVSFPPGTHVMKREQGDEAIAAKKGKEVKNANADEGNERFGNQD